MSEEETKDVSEEEKNVSEENAKEAEVKADEETKTQPESEDEGKEKETETDESPEKSQKKEKFRKKEKKQIEELEIKNAELSDLLKRNMAEFDNFRKRTDKEKASRFEMGQRSVVEKLLPIIDNFERGLAGLDEEAKKEPFAEGILQTYKQLQGFLEELGVKPIEAVGQSFNPDLHNAVMHVDDEQYGENEIVEELMKGYKMGDAVVRYSMVKVAN